MRRKVIIPIVVVAAVIAVLVGVLVVPARGGSGTTTAAATKTTLTPLELIGKVAATLPGTKAVHGTFTWTNGILGSTFQLPAQAPDLLKKLWDKGSGEFWFQGGKLRLQAGNGTDQVTVVMNGKSVWVYDSTSNTATRYAMPARGEHKGGMDRGGMGMWAKPSSGAGGFNLGKLGNLGSLSKLMSAVVLSVTQQTVAGQSAYVLTVEPTATNTTFGSFNVAFDGTTFVPLSVNVMAAGSSTAVFDATMTKVDYNAIAASEFQFAPPAGAKIVHGDAKAHLDKARMHKNGEGKHPGPAGMKAMMRTLTVAQAQAKVGFPLLSLTTPPSDLSFQGAYVVGQKKAARFAILRYGQGFGTIVFAEGKLTDAQQKQVLDALGVTKLGTSATWSGIQGEQVTTPLVNAFIWTVDGVFHVAGGPVPVTQLQTFVTGLH